MWITSCSPRQIIYIKKYTQCLETSAEEDGRKTKQAEANISLGKWKEQTQAEKIEYFITQKILIPPIDAWQLQMEMYISSKIQNCDVFEWCLHLNFILLLFSLHPSRALFFRLKNKIARKKKEKRKIQIKLSLQNAVLRVR